MPTGPDIAVFSPDHRLQLVVEVKSTPDAGEDWAAKLRRNLLSHGAIPSAPYFLLVLPEHLYLWSNAPEGAPVRPDFRANTRTVLYRYLSHAGRDPGPVSERGLELAVRAWLSDLTDPHAWSRVSRPEDDWLRESGLADRIRTGIVKTEP
jgi:hypothetical protein